MFVGLDLFDRNNNDWTFRKNIPGIEEDYDKSGYKVKMPPNVIRSIILGCNMEEKTKLIAIAEKLGVSIYEAELGTPYQLNFKQIR